MLEGHRTNLSRRSPNPQDWDNQAFLHGKQSSHRDSDRDSQRRAEDKDKYVGFRVDHGIAT